MKRKILAPGDFSTQPDRALRRVSLLARRMEADLILDHVADDESQSQQLTAEANESGELLNCLAATMRVVDYVSCDIFGEPIAAIAAIAKQINADIIVTGPHRRRAFAPLVEAGLMVSRVPPDSFRSPAQPWFDLNSLV